MKRADHFVCPTCGQPTAAPVDPVVAGRLRLDPVKGLVFLDGEQIHFTPSEYALIERMARNPERVHPKWALQEAMGGRSADEKIVDVIVSKVRGKFAVVSAAEVVSTVRGEGYTIAPDIYLQRSIA